MAAATQRSDVDVLIIGAGPAGLMAATWMSRLGIRTRIIDKRGTKVFNGQADGLQCRSLEIFDSFGFADRVWKESNHMLEICMWNPGPDGVIHRSSRIPDTIPGISRFQQVVLHQGRIERFFLDHIKKHSTLNGSPIAVERGVLPESFTFDEALAADIAAGKVNGTDKYPIEIKLRHLTDEEATPAQNLTSVSDGLFRSSLADDDTDDLIRKASGKGTETVRAKYMIGCDGAHSWTRRQLGFEMEGDSTDYIWGVLDIVPITNFPDIRMRCAIHSESSGSLMNIPRENHLTRLYIQLASATPDSATGRADRALITPAVILAAAQKILHPYTLTYEYIDWWTAYQIGQRVGTSFSKRERIFLTGDACHCHSPKAGQGMNVSMQDSYNLGWKIGLVVKGVLNPVALKSYESERMQVARDLIAFDHKFSRLFSGRPAKDAADEAGVSMEVFKEAFEKGNMFASGLIVDYGASVLVDKDGAGQRAATKLVVGMRFPSFKVLNQSDARPWHLAEWLKSDGRFRIILFAGDITIPAQHATMERFCDKLQGILKTYTRPGKKNNSVIQPITVHCAPREAVDIFSFPEVLRPFDEDKGWEYNQIFVDAVSYHEGFGDAYTNYGVSKDGAVVVVRPDGYVALVTGLEDVASVEKYFEGALVSVA